METSEAQMPAAAPSVLQARLQERVASLRARMEVARRQIQQDEALASELTSRIELLTEAHTS